MVLARTHKVEQMAKTEVIAEQLEFFVDEETCIGCVACADMYSDIFKMVGDKAIAFASAEAGAVAHAVGPLKAGHRHQDVVVEVPTHGGLLFLEHADHRELASIDLDRLLDGIGEREQFLGE